MNDPLHDALRDATLAVLLGTTSAPYTYSDSMGNPIVGTVSIPSAFGQRLQSQAFKGEFDELIRQAMEKVDSTAVARAVEGLLAEQILAGLARRDSSYGRSEPNWLQDKAKSIAVEACTIALSADEGLLDTLRAKIGAEVDRNRVGITVNLSDPETASRQGS